MALPRKAAKRAQPYQSIRPPRRFPPPRYHAPPPTTFGKSLIPRHSSPIAKNGFALKNTWGIRERSSGQRRLSGWGMNPEPEPERYR